MKEKLIPILIAAAIVCTSVSFVKSASNNTIGMDVMKENLSDLEQLLPLGADFSYVPLYMDSARSIGIFHLMRYAFAPRNIYYNEPDRDTVFSMLGRYPTRAEFNTIVAGRNIIWRKRDGDIFFFLTNKRK